MTDMEISKFRSEASGRSRSNVCSECRFISFGGRCQKVSARYAQIVVGHAACEDFSKTKGAADE